MSDTIRFACQCGSKVKASTDLAGEVYKCPQCGKPLIVPQVPEAIVEATPPVEASSLPFDFIRLVWSLYLCGVFVLLLVNWVRWYQLEYVTHQTVLLLETLLLIGAAFTCCVGITAICWVSIQRPKPPQ